MKSIGVIGHGHMGSSIAHRLKGEYLIHVFDTNAKKTKGVSDIKVAKTIQELLKEAEILVLAVKPQHFSEVLKEIKSYLVKDKLIISIAAGISTFYIENFLGRVRLVRAMPNLALRIGAGMTCIAKGAFATKEDFDFVEQLFNRMGETIRINEDLMDAATAVSGSGPGFFYWFLEKEKITSRNIPDNLKNDFKDRLAKAAREIGFDVHQAMILANGTVAGSSALLSETGLLPKELKEKVASKGGTTEAGITALNKGSSLEDAVKAALSRAKELAKGK